MAFNFLYSKIKKAFPISEECSVAYSKPMNMKKLIARPISNTGRVN